MRFLLLAFCIITILCTILRIDATHKRARSQFEEESSGLSSPMADAEDQENHANTASPTSSPFEKLPTEILRRLFYLGATRVENDRLNATRRYRLVNREWRHTISTTYPLWKIRIKTGCTHSNNSKKAAKQENRELPYVDMKALFYYGKLSFKHVEIDDRCFKAIMSALNPPKEEIPSIRALDWQSYQPSQEETKAFLAIFTKVAPTLEEFFLSCLRLFPLGAQNTNTESSTTTSLEFSKAFNKLNATKLTSLKLRLLPLIEGFNGDSQAARKALERLKRLQFLQLATFPILTVPLQDESVREAISTKLFQAFHGKPLSDIRIDFADGENSVLDSKAVASLVRNSYSTLRRFQVIGYGCSLVIEWLAMPVEGGHRDDISGWDKLQKLRSLKIIDLSPNSQPLPSDTVRSLLALPHLDFVHFSQMRARDLNQWLPLASETAKWKELTFIGRSEMFPLIWSTGFPRVNVIDSNFWNMEVLFPFQAIPKLKFRGNEFIESVEYSQQIVNDLLPGAPSQNFANLQSLDMQLLAVDSAWILADKLKFLPELRNLRLSVYINEENGIQPQRPWEDRLLLGLMAAPRLESLDIKLHQPLLEPMNLLWVIEFLAVEKVFASNLRIIRIQAPTLQHLQFPNTKNILSRLLMPILLSTSLLEMILIFDDEIAFHWDRFGVDNNMSAE